MLVTEDEAGDYDLSLDPSNIQVVKTANVVGDKEFSDILKNLDISDKYILLGPRITHQTSVGKDPIYMFEVALCPRDDSLDITFDDYDRAEVIGEKIADELYNEWPDYEWSSCVEESTWSVPMIVVSSEPMTTVDRFDFSDDRPN